MNLTKSVPIIITNDLDAVRTFYLSVLGFVLSFDSPGYIGLRHPTNPNVELGFMRPEAGQTGFAGAGLFLGLEVTDVDAEYARMKAAEVPILQPPTDKPWGDRSFTLRDPLGIILYVNSPISPAQEFKQYYR